MYKSKEPAPAKVGVGWTRDVSDGGACLELAELLPPGTPLSVILQTDQGSLGVEGKVVWVESPEARTPGQPIRHGLRFTNLSWAHELTLGLLLAEVPAEAAPKERGRPHGQ